MAEFSFIEISYDPSVAKTDFVESNLKKLGFIHRTQHKSGSTGFLNNVDSGISQIRRLISLKEYQMSPHNDLHTNLQIFLTQCIRKS